MFDKFTDLIPTDNLYKFMALSGIIMFFFCLFYPEWRVYTQKKEALAILSKIKVARVEMSILDKQISVDSAAINDYMKYAMQLAGKLKKRVGSSRNFDTNLGDLSYQELAEFFYDKKFRDSYSFVLDHKKDIFPQELEESTQSLKDHSLKVDKSRLLLAEYEGISDIMTFENERLENISNMGLLGRIAGLIISLSGFILWYVNLQRPQDKILQKQLADRLENP